jgi:hypothetical protein
MDSVNTHAPNTCCVRFHNIKVFYANKRSFLIVLHIQQTNCQNILSLLLEVASLSSKTLVTLRLYTKAKLAKVLRFITNPGMFCDANLL